jgi:type 1 fimbria pilin
MKVKKLIVASLAILALASSSLASAADVPPPALTVGPSVVKVRNGKIVLTATCVGEAKCQSVLTARIAVRNGGLGGQIFRVEPGQTKNLVFNLRPEVRTWLKSHRRSTLVIEARTSDENYDVVWRGTFRLSLVA